MPETKTYGGGCHCGAIRYEVTADVNRLMACNCSICSKKGTLLTFVGTDQFKMLSGEGELTDYQFNKHNIHHLFCRKCGIASFANGTGPDGKKMVAINARCLDGLDLAKVPVAEFDGKSM